MLNIFRRKDELAGKTIIQCPHCMGFVKGNDVKCRHCRNLIQQKQTVSVKGKNEDKESDLDGKKFTM
jgi:hypothetical protein